MGVWRRGSVGGGVRERGGEWLYCWLWELACEFVCLGRGVWVCVCVYLRVVVGVWVGVCVWVSARCAGL